MAFLNKIILGVTGTWEGWVPTATDLYLRGNNIMNWKDFSSSHALVFASGEINGFPGANFDLRSQTAKNLSGFSKINFQIRQRTSIQEVPIGGGKYFLFFLKNFSTTDDRLLLSSYQLDYPMGAQGEKIDKTFSFPFTYNATGFLQFRKASASDNCSIDAIYRIWLS